MLRRLYIPRAVMQSIAQHLDQSIERAVADFWSANEDEDTLTGDLGACLRTGTHSVEVTRNQNEEIYGLWKWSMDYAKFRGRGKGATESYLGADGIFELRLSWGSRTETKSILFQSKVNWHADQNLVRQAILLSTWREAAIVINYTPTGFEAYSIDSILASKGERASAQDGQSLKKVLGEYFLECKIGNTDLVYDPRARKLAWRASTGVRVATQFSIPHRIRINIQSPLYKERFTYDKLIPLDEIHSHRMEAEPEDVLMPLLSDREETPKARRQALAMTYHPDRYPILDQFLKDLATRRMQEVNAAFDKIKKTKD
jgi:hypothetical protein